MVDYFPIFGSGGFYTVMQQWQQFGVFTILLPLVLVFSVVFAILEKVDLFKNKGVHIIIAIAVGFFTVSNPYITAFFLPLFSNLGLGIAILIILVILLGLVIKTDDEGKFLSKTFVWIFGIVGAAIFLVVIAKAGIFQLVFGPNIVYWLEQNAAWLILFIFLVIIIIGVIKGVGGGSGKKKGQGQQAQQGG